MIGLALLALVTSLRLLVHAEPVTRRQSAPNPYVSTFPAGAQVGVSATAHASFFQVVSLHDQNANLCALTGTGEDVQMLNHINGGQQPSCVYGALGSSASVTLTAQFLFSRSGPSGPLNTAFLSAPEVASEGDDLLTIMMQSEDGVDTDDNDTTASISVLDLNGLPPSVNAKDVVLPVAFGTLSVPGGISSDATLDFSTGITDKIHISVDAFSGASTTTDFVASSLVWGTVAGKIADDTSSNPWVNYVTFRFVFSGGKIGGMENSELHLKGHLSYAKSHVRPTGFQDVIWYSGLMGSNITVTVQ